MTVALEINQEIPAENLRQTVSAQHLEVCWQCQHLFIIPESKPHMDKRVTDIVDDITHARNGIFNLAKDVTNVNHSQVLKCYMQMVQKLESVREEVKYWASCDLSDLETDDPMNMKEKIVPDGAGG